MIQLTWQVQASNRDPIEGGDTVDMTFDVLLIDGTVRESYSFEQDITSNPVERGASLTDHSKRKPVVIELDCIVSDDPYDGRLEEEDHTITVRDTFVFLKDRAIPVDIETDRGLFETYLISSVVDSIDPTTGDGGLFSVICKEFLYATTEEVTAPAPIVERARPRQSNGQQNAAATGSTETVSRSNPDNSVLLDAWESFGL